MLTVFKSTCSRRRQATKNSLLLVLTIIWAVIYVGRKDQTRKNLLQNWNNVEQIEKRNVGKEETKRDVQGKVRISNISQSSLRYWNFGMWLLCVIFLHSILRLLLPPLAAVVHLLCTLVDIHAFLCWTFCPFIHQWIIKFFIHLFKTGNG